MSADDGDADRLPPDEAFAALGNETRMDVLRSLGELDSPVSFSELFDAVAVEDSGQFNYHLDRMVGHFVERDDDGYQLAPAGRRVVEAVLSGAVTGGPDLEPTTVEESCQYCGAPIRIRWANGGVEEYCTECGGRYGQVQREGGSVQTPLSEEGYLGRLPFPPAGVADRSPDEILGAAWTWGNLEILSMASGVCPRCSGAIERTVDRCETHEDGDGVCPDCGRRSVVGVGFECRNCILTTGGHPVLALAATTELLGLLTDAGHNPISPDSVRAVETVHSDYEETVLSTEPFRAQYTFIAGDERLVLTVDETLSVVDAERHETG